MGHLEKVFLGFYNHLGREIDSVPIEESLAALVPPGTVYERQFMGIVELTLWNGILVLEVSRMPYPGRRFHQGVHCPSIPAVVVVTTAEGNILLPLQEGDNVEGMPVDETVLIDGFLCPIHHEVHFLPEPVGVEFFKDEADELDGDATPEEVLAPADFHC